MWPLLTRGGSCSRRAWRCPQGLIHGDEPLRCIAKDHRLLGTPGVGVLVLQSTARDQHTGMHKRLDDGVVSITLVAFLVDYTTALEVRCVVGQAPVCVHGEGYCGIDALPF